VIGTGADGALPVMKQVHQEARRRKVDLVILPTAQAIDVLAGATKDTCSTHSRAAVSARSMPSQHGRPTGLPAGGSSTISTVNPGVNEPWLSGLLRLLSKVRHAFWGDP
jgi:hypothetical protein